ncbi:hypothetical protein HOY82DRAFT_314335 [Tuber indicum]|nr:hypothetical protein HOY82DRAFT_314335 [Tuber indicum]
MPKKGSAKNKEVPTRERYSPPPPPSWPPLTPVIPFEDLTVETILPTQILTIPKFFTATLCNTYLNFASQSLDLTTTPGNPKRGEAVRVNDRISIYDLGFAERLWNETGLKDLVAREAGEDGRQELWGGEVVGLSPNIRVYRYSKGQFFDKHYDDTASFSVGDPQMRVQTTWTLLIYLTGKSDGVRGGETVFYTEATKHTRGEEYAIEPEKGTALLHKHGAHCLLHEGRVVTEDAGVGKWVLRSDLIVRR